MNKLILSLLLILPLHASNVVDDVLEGGHNPGTSYTIKNYSVEKGSALDKTLKKVFKPHVVEELLHLGDKLYTKRVLEHAGFHIVDFDKNILMRHQDLPGFLIIYNQSMDYRTAIRNTGGEILFFTLPDSAERRIALYEIPVIKAGGNGTWKAIAAGSTIGFAVALGMLLESSRTGNIHRSLESIANTLVNINTSLDKNTDTAKRPARPTGRHERKASSAGVND